MNGLWPLIILILSAALPVLIAFFCFRVRKFPLGTPWFFICLLAGIASLFLAAFIQFLIPAGTVSSVWNLIFRIFVKIAFTEELGRFLVLLFLFAGLRRFKKGDVFPSMPFWAASGLIAGLGFAFAETASYAVADINLVFVRTLTAAPLHGACGSRIGSAVMHLGKEKPRAFFQFMAAVGIHGMYNLLLISPGVPLFIPVLIAFTALGSSLLKLRSSSSDAQPLT